MKILVSIDLSASTPHLLDYAKNLAKSLSARGRACRASTGVIGNRDRHD